MPRDRMKAQRSKVKVYAVVLVGGKGKRLQPITTDSRPKAFLPITKDDKTMFRMTLNRIAKFIPSSDIVIVANEIHKGLVLKDFPDVAKNNLILEPISRNTAPAIALAASVLKNRTEDAIMVVLPADHYITGDEKYLSAIKKCIGFINKNGEKEPLLIFGLKPTFPAIGFGYIKVRPKGSGGVYKVERFVEKPDLDTAKEYVKSGRYLWNSGMFIFKVSSLLKAVRRYAPAIYDGLNLSDAAGLDRAYEKLPDISIDYAIMEKAENIYCVKGTYGWQDLGTFKSLHAHLKKELKGFAKASKKYRSKPSSSLNVLEAVEMLLKKNNL